MRESLTLRVILARRPRRPFRRSRQGCLWSWRSHRLRRDGPPGPDGTVGRLVLSHNSAMRG